MIQKTIVTFIKPFKEYYVENVMPLYDKVIIVVGVLDTNDCTMTMIG